LDHTESYVKIGRAKNRSKENNEEVREYSGLDQNSNNKGSEAFNIF
jgi:hypothetical protein